MAAAVVAGVVVIVLQAAILADNRNLELPFTRKEKADEPAGVSRRR